MRTDVYMHYRRKFEEIVLTPYIKAGEHMRKNVNITTYEGLEPAVFKSLSTRFAADVFFEIIDRTAEPQNVTLDIFHNAFQSSIVIALLLYQFANIPKLRLTLMSGYERMQSGRRPIRRELRNLCHCQATHVYF